MSSPPVISALPAVPATSDPNFETLAPALFTAIKNTFISEVNAVAGWINAGNWLTTPPVFDSCTILGNLTVDTNTFVVNAATNRVGIGNSSPATVLDIWAPKPQIIMKDTSATGSGAYAIFSFRDNTNNNIGYIGYGSTTDSNLGINNLLAGNIVLSTNSKSLAFNSSGNLGVGVTSSISARIHALATTEQLRLGYDGSNYVKCAVASGGATFYEAVGSNNYFSWTTNKTTGVPFTYHNQNANAYGCFAAYATEGVSRGYIGALKHGSSADVFFNGETADGFGIKAETVMQFGIGSTGVMQMTSGGLAIGGLYNPATKLHVQLSNYTAYSASQSLGARDSVLAVFENADNTITDGYAAFDLVAGSSYAAATRFVTIGVGGATDTSTDFAILTRDTSNDLTEKLRIKNGGKIGIGTSSPLGKLDSRSTSGAQLVASYDNSNSTGITTNGAGDCTISPTGDGLTLDANDIRINQTPAGAAGSATGTYARINFNGTYYKLALLADS